MKFELLKNEEKEIFKEVYYKALKNNWDTLEHPESPKPEERERNLKEWFYFGYRIYLAKDNNSIIGYATTDGHRILNLWINEKYRRKGIGHKLLLFLFKKEYDKDNQYFISQVVEENIPFFKKLGFKIKDKGLTFFNIEISSEQVERLIK